MKAELVSSSAAKRAGEPVRSLKFGAAAGPEELLTREWLVTNGLGGYSSGTISGVMTRRHHGLLIASLPAGFGRMVMLTDCAERLVRSDGSVVALGGEERAECLLRLHGAGFLREFRLESGVPVWSSVIDGMTIEKRIWMPYRQNSVIISYRVAEGEGSARLELRPSVNFRSHEAPVNTPLAPGYTLAARDEGYELVQSPDFPRLRVKICGHSVLFSSEPAAVREVIYRTEESLGYEARGDLWSPGYFSAVLAPDREVALVASTESWETMDALDPGETLLRERARRDALISGAVPQVRRGCGAELVLAADQFIITPPGRREDMARAQAYGEEARSVIAGYPWFTDWGRDTMISLEGLTLVTGRYKEAEWILRTFADYLRNGLIPNMFPEGARKGLYHTADATLWFFHALDRYIDVTGDGSLLPILLPRLQDIIHRHLQGTDFGIHADPDDGLLCQGQEGYALTWMDAKVEDWVVTPRRGKAVEINALWYNSLRLLAGWVRGLREERKAEEFERQAEKIFRSFNERFWYDEGKYLYDVIDGESGCDSTCRPNQIIALSLRHPVLEQKYWKPVVHVVADRLLTPVGLRSLAPGNPDYRPRYYGDCRSRDAAYHQGTVWMWLIGPFVDAWLKCYPDDLPGARNFLQGCREHLNDACVGSLSEIFDADAPFAARGCIAQAWSVAEVLRQTAALAE